MERKIKEQDEKIISLTKLSTEKEMKLNAEILKYQKEISKLNSQIELSNTIISDLTEEKENNIKQINDLKKENEMLVQKNNIISKESSDKDKKINELSQQIENAKSNTIDQNTLKNYKRVISTLNTEKKELEEIVMKQEEKVSEISKKLSSIADLLEEKEKELKDSIEYTAKLTSMLNTQKKENAKLKHSGIPKEKEESLQNEINTLKKEIQKKDYRLNVLSLNNKIMISKLQKQSQIIPGLNTKNTKPIAIINNNQNPNKNDFPLSAKENRNKVVLGKIKPHSQQQNKKNPTNIAGNIAKRNNKYISGSLSNFKEENYKIKEDDNTFHSNKTTSKDKFLIVAKSKSKAKTPVKLNHFELIDEDQIGTFEEKEKEISIIAPSNNSKPPHIDAALEVEFPIIESFCVMNGTMKTEDENNDNNEDDDDEGDKEVAKLHNCVDKILKEF